MQQVDWPRPEIENVPHAKKYVFKKNMLPDLLGASGWYLEALGHRRHREYQDALQDPKESQEETKS